MTLPILSAALLAAGSPATPNPPMPLVVETMAVPLAKASVDRAVLPSLLVADVAGLAADTQTAPASPPIAPTDPASTPAVDGIEPALPETDGGDIIVQARQEMPGDPLENVNVEAFHVVNQVDDALVAPVAMAYRDGLPHQLRDAISNFFANLREPVVAINYLLQLKPGKAIETIARMAINTTVGIGGLIDVAEERPFNLPHRNNGFANTLGYYGVGPGPFLVLPLIGVTSLRDLVGNSLDQLVLPTAIGRPFNTPYYSTPAYLVTALDYRIEFDDALTTRRNSADPYASTRDAYLARRHAEIEALHGRTVAAADSTPTAEPVTPPQP